jgi:hypothetical protein
MQGRFLDVYIILLMMFIAGTAIVLAEGTGKIAGQLIDDQSGDPIEAATVMVVGSRRGAVTDFSGRYVIGGLVPGTYTLQISKRQYNSVTVTGVAVRSDRSADISHRMTVRTRGIDSVVVVSAESDTLKVGGRDQGLTISKKDIQKTPVSTVDDLLEQVSGVVTNEEGEVFIRGGRAFEVAYVQDGGSLSEPTAGFDQARVNATIVHPRRIWGELSDAESGKPIKRASVMVVGTHYKVVTDSKGQFLIRDVPDGCYEVVLSCKGYKTTKIGEVAVGPGQGAKLYLRLEKTGRDTVSKE